MQVSENKTPRICPSSSNEEAWIMATRLDQSNKMDIVKTVPKHQDGPRKSLNPAKICLAQGPVLSKP